MIRDTLELVVDLWGLLRDRKKYWLAPLIFVLLLTGIFIVLLHSAAAPFIYTIF